MEPQALRHRRGELHAGSHEFYLGYAVSRKLLSLDAGHYHPTEGIADKISSVLCFLPEIAAARQPRGALGQRPCGHPYRRSPSHRAGDRPGRLRSARVRIGLDYFDASINRVAAWVIGARNMRKALLLALARAIAKLRQLEAEGDYTSRLA